MRKRMKSVTVKNYKFLDFGIYSIRIYLETAEVSSVERFLSVGAVYD